jgi:hypothetical protein
MRRAGEDDHSKRQPVPETDFETWIDGDYVQTPGDRGFDELIFQHKPAHDNVAATVEYALHDDAGDLVALLNRPNPTDHGRVALQETYDPYGEPPIAKMLWVYPPPRIGHKGMFVERLDTTTMLGTERLSSGVAGGTTSPTNGPRLRATGFRLCGCPCVLVPLVLSPTHWLTARGRTRPLPRHDRALHPVPCDGRDARLLTRFRASITLQIGRLEYLNTAGATPEAFFAWCDFAATPSA